MKKRKRVELGEYVVSDPEICGGDLTFKGTRMLVKDALAMVAKGYDWDRISEEFYGRVSHGAIAEAIELARQALIEKNDKKIEKRKRAA
jgi:uncharacterized protein (DUF433 family)